MKYAAIAVIVVVAAAIFWLTRRPSASAAPPVADLTSGVVRLSIREEASQSPTERSFLLVFGSSPDTSRVRFVFAPKEIPAKEPAAFTTGRLLRIAGSIPNPLIDALAEAHEGTGSTAPSTRADSLPIDLAYFGNALSAGSSDGWNIAGAFTNKPAGPWLVVKLFIADPAARDKEQEPGELFLALNPSSGEGLFLVKDPAYWPTLAAALGTVL